MAWHRLPNSDEIDPDFKRRCRFLVDESLGREMAIYLRTRGYNTKFAADVGLSGRADEEVLAYAWRDHRMLLTHDRDFLDDTRFPEHRNPGIVILPGGAGDNQAMTVGVFTALRVFGFGPSIWAKTKASVSSTGEVTIRCRDFNTGKIESRRYRLTRSGVEQWRK
jgi:predicted nuclease of predicted toxin-antitoxin system